MLNLKLVKFKPSVTIFLVVFLLLSFLVSIPFSVVLATMPSEVASTDSNSATAFANQRKTFFANDRFWAWYTNSTYFLFTSSADGETWLSSTSIGQILYGYETAVFFDGTHVHYTRSYNYVLYYRMGTPNSDGSITWSAAEQTVALGSSSCYCNFPAITVDTGGYAWIGTRNQSAASKYYPAIFKNANSDGTWSNATGFPYQLSATISSLWRVTPCPLTNQKMYIIYGRGSYAIRGILYDGGWGSEETDVGDYNIYGGADASVVNEEDNVHFVYLTDSPYQVRYNKRTYGVGWETNDVLIQDAVSANSAPTISILKANYLYCFYAIDTSYISYKKCLFGVWDTDNTVWIDESSDKLTATDRITSFFKCAPNSDKIGIIYSLKTNPPCTVKFACTPSLEYDYVDNNSSNVDSNANIGTSSNFTTEKYTDNINDTLTEAAVANSTQVVTQLWVNGNTSTYGAWTEAGTQPYLNAIDDPTNIISTATGSAAEGYFNFTDLSTTAVSVSAISLCVYGKSADGYIVTIYNSTGGSQDFTHNPLSSDYAWYNDSILPTLPTASEVNGAYIKFVYEYSGGKATTTLDAALLSVTYNYTSYQLAIEEQWTNANYTRTNRELDIFMGASSNGETIGLQWWNTTSSTWLTINSSLVANAWNNITVTSYLIAATFTIRFYDGTQTVDTVQSNWQKDCALLRTWETGGPDITAPTYSGVTANSTVWATSCNFSATLADETGLSSYTFGCNNTGVFANDTSIIISGLNYKANTTKTLNSINSNATQPEIIRWQYWLNDTANNNATTGLQTLTLSWPLTVGWNNVTIFSFDVGFTLAGINASLNYDGMNWSSIIYQNSSTSAQYVFVKGMSYNAAIKVYQTTGILLIFCVQAGNWTHTYPLQGGDYGSDPTPYIVAGVAVGIATLCVWIYRKLRRKKAK
jgi:hypothetical protein